MKRSLLCLGVTAGIAFSAGAADATVLERSGQFAAGIPAPETVLAFAPGERPVRYHEAVAYYEALASASDRVSLRDYGRTAAGRRLFVLTISAPENLARLDEIRSRLRQLGDEAPEKESARDLIAKLPASAWMGYGIHGSEISGPDAALELAYRLAAGTDEGTLKLLRNLVIHVDPMFNPDGRERTLAHSVAFSRRTANEDPYDLSRRAFWPGGRGNHYFFDLNRDALYTVQGEARARVAAILDARPQLYIDAHEMSYPRTFLFAVPAAPFNPLLPPSVHRSWEEFAVDHAAAFDRDGTSYYTRSWNEVFYPGYFDIWPAYFGAVPMIYEQAGTSGGTVRLPNGTRRTYSDSVEHQLRSSLTNLQTASDNREALLTRWWQERRDASRGSGTAQKRFWVILPDDAYKLERAVKTLRAQGVVVEFLEHATRASNLHSIWEPDSRTMELPAGTALVRTTQPHGAVIRNLFDLHVPMPARFLRRERRLLDLDEPSLLYDTTAWSLPHAYGANVLWSDSVPAGNWRALAEGEASSEPTPVIEGRYGYLYRDPSLFVTARLLDRGVKVRVARQPFTHSGSHYDNGTLLVRNDDQSKIVIEDLRSEQQNDRTTFLSLDSARVVEGGPDFGDEAFHLLSAPKIAVLAGPMTDSLNVGATIHLFDESVGVPFTLLDFDDLGRLTEGGYNVLVLPDLEQGDAAPLSAENLDRLKHWVQGGGTLIAVRGGARALAASGWTVTKPRQDVADKYPPLMFGRSAQAVMAQDFIRAVGAGPLQPPSSTAEVASTVPVIGSAARLFANSESAQPFEFPAATPTLEHWLEGVAAPETLRSQAGKLLRRYLPRGAYLSAEFKPAHWLGSGVPERLPVMFREPEVLIADGSAQVVGRYTEPSQLAVSGLVWPEAVGYIGSTAYLVREKQGAGQIILFANDPLFRGYSLGTQRLFMNAAILGPAFK